MPGLRVVERRNRRGEAVPEEQPAPADSSCREGAAARELVDSGARMPSSSATSAVDRTSARVREFDSISAAKEAFAKNWPLWRGPVSRRLAP
jgi:hypothetical protein